MRRSRRWLAIIPIASALAACDRAGDISELVDPTSQRSISSGEVVGFAHEAGGHAWLGIPYAAPPVADLRFRAPRPPLPWEGAREAIEFGDRCVQLASSLEGDRRAGMGIGSEDCLFLNVYAPRFAAEAVPAGEARLPVMVWIHGGGNTIGSADFYDGGILAAGRERVVVTLNYRLGPLGWFRHASLRGEGSTADDRSGNFGTLDTLQALRWVQENIAAFGGDPGNVTIFGESAGGADVLMLMLSPLAEGLFHRAIAQSAGTGTDDPGAAERFVDDSEPGDPHSSNEALLRLLQFARLAADRDQAKARLEAMSPEEVAAFVRGRNAFELLSAYQKEDSELGFVDLPMLFRDGHVLPEQEVHEAFAAGHYHRVPVILGSNRDEEKLFLYADRDHVRQWFGFLPRLRDPEGYARLAYHLSRAWKANSVDTLARSMRAVQGDSVYAYQFDWDEEPTILGADLSLMLGAAHAFEIPFVFGHWDLGSAGNMIFTTENAPGREALSEAMMGYWAEFAATGKPGGGGNHPLWAPWDDSSATGTTHVVFDTPEDGGVRMEASVLSPDVVLAELADDPNADAALRCEILAQIQKRWSAFEDAPQLASFGCEAPSANEAR